MKTMFPKMQFGPKDLPKWSFYFDAGGQWLRTYELVRDAKNDKVNPTWLYYVEPHALYFAIELFSKSLAARVNPSFDAQKDMTSDNKRIGHSATAIIQTYADRIPAFSTIVKNRKLFDLIKIYEATLTTRFGETGVSINGDDAKLLFETAESMWNEINIARQVGIKPKTP